MKKIYLIIIIFLLFNSVKAIVPSYIDCYYDLKYKYGESDELLFTKIKIEIDKYNTAESSMKFYYMQYEEKDNIIDSIGYQEFEKGKGPVDIIYKDSNKAFPNPTAGFNMFSLGGVSFDEKYKENTKCPQIYLLFDDNQYAWTVSTESHNFATAQAIDVNYEQLSTNNVNWYERNHFFELYSIETKEDKVCDNGGNGYNIELNSIPEPFTIKFITEYKLSGEPSLYKIDIDGQVNNETTVSIEEFTNLDYLYINIANIRSGFEGYLKIDKEEMENIFMQSDCPTIVYGCLNQNTGISTREYFITTSESRASEECHFAENNFSNYDGFEREFPSMGEMLGSGTSSCRETLGENLTQLIRTAVRIFQGAAVVAALINGMIMFIPAIFAKDVEAMKTSSKKFVKMLGVLAAILILPVIVKIIAYICGLDITCLM